MRIFSLRLGLNWEKSIKSGFRSLKALGHGEFSRAGIFFSAY
jgi:hypothetical protein